MKYIDLSHTFTDNMPVFPGDPKTSLKQITSIEKNGYTDHSLTTVMHVGTHMDAPLHMIENGKYMDEMPLSNFTGPGVFINAYKKMVIDADILDYVQILPGSIILLYTGMSEVYGTEEYDSKHPSLTEAFARVLVERNISMIGMDMINPDILESYPIHKILLSKEVLIIENLTNLQSLVGIPSFEVFAFPIKMHAEAAAVRVVARIS
jgi:kynurenine formamidase